MLDPELAREQYVRELERSHNLTSAVNLPVAVLTGLGGLAALMAERFDYASWLRVPFVVSLAATVAAFGGTVALLARAYVGEKTAYLPAPREMAEFYGNLETLYIGLDLPSEGADADFREQLSRWHMNSADRNRITNDLQTGRLTRAGQGLVAVLIGLALCGILYVADALRTV